MLRVLNTYYFSTAAMVTRTRLNVTFICTSPVRYVEMPFQLLEITTDYAQKSQRKANAVETVGRKAWKW